MGDHPVVGGLLGDVFGEAVGGFGVGVAGAAGGIVECRHCALGDRGGGGGGGGWAGIILGAPADGYVVELEAGGGGREGSGVHGYVCE